MDLIARLVVLGFGGYLICLSVAGVMVPAATDRFLGGFASSARVHILEQAARIVVGLALIRHAPSMRGALGFTWFGWILVVTSVALLLVPWRLHRRFAERTVPWALRYRALYLVGAFVLGTLILASGAPG